VPSTCKGAVGTTWPNIGYARKSQSLIFRPLLPSARVYRTNYHHRIRQQSQ
jgi:hypothetical protein